MAEQTPARAEADRRPNRRIVRSATVTGSEWLSPELVRVRLTGAGVADLPELTYTDHYIKILFPPAGADYQWPFDPDELRISAPRELWPVTRTYTIRWLERTVPEMVVDFVVHGNEGLAGSWAAAARAGDQIGFRGPGGGYAPSPEFGHHVLAGDEAAIPAIAAALERLPSSATATAFLEVADQDSHPPVPCGDRVEINWIHRDGHPYGESLAAAVRAGALPDENTQVFVHGNAAMIKDLRRFFFVEKQLDRDRASISGYWRSGMNEDGWQSGKREFVAAMEAEEQAAVSAR
jgi:NADPH-dependent ferric siderophore reductase